MKNLLRILLYFYSLPILACQTEQMLDLYANHVPLTQLIAAIADQQKMNLAVPYALEGHASLQITQICGATLLKQLAETYQLSIKQHANLWIISPQLTNQANSLITSTINLQYSSPAEIATKIANAGILSEHAKVTIVPHKQQLIFYETLQNILRIEDFVRLLDQKRGQVHISAQLVTINREQLQELGIKWSAQVDKSQIKVNLGIANPSSQTTIHLGKWIGRFLELELSALEAEHKVEIIAAPHLITQDGYSASIKQGTEIPYEVTKDGSSSFEFKQAVLGLEVTPTILNDNEVLLTLYITQNNPGVPLKRIDGGNTITIDTQEITTQLLVTQGETLVLGGIKQKQQIKKQDRVPVLGKLPLFGNLFKHQQVKEESRELVIFITPHIL